MALLTRKEFLDKCGIPSKDLSVYLRREKVIMTDDRFDDANPINALFIQKHQNKAPKKPATEAENAVAPPSGDKPVKAITLKGPARADGRRKDRFDERFDLDTQKKKAEIDKIERETQIAEMKHEKMMGKLLPADVTRGVITHTIKNFTIAFKQAADKVVQEFASRTKMNRNDQALMKGELIQVINHASEDAVLESKKSIGTLIREYAEAKEL